eukprot:TRINITY_DN14017_c0_g1_i1.p3 TRINITY_DN14017_c0_g1~~TRINITY_DN14017_c0_g1_i1.p3  ORF type:complete len:181 (-),score=51.56 TRINITY_DN14017_c0_g1_i1:106-603(-)
MGGGGGGGGGGWSPAAEVADLEGTWRGSGVLLRARSPHREAVESVTRFTRRPFGGVEVAGRVTPAGVAGTGAPAAARRSPDWWEAEEEERSLVPAAARLDGRMLFFGRERVVTLLAGGGWPLPPRSSLATAAPLSLRPPTSYPPTCASVSSAPMGPTGSGCIRRF